MCAIIIENLLVFGQAEKTVVRYFEAICYACPPLSFFPEENFSSVLAEILSQWHGPVGFLFLLFPAPGQKQSIQSFYDRERERERVDAAKAKAKRRKSKRKEQTFRILGGPQRISLAHFQSLWGGREAVVASNRQLFLREKERKEEILRRKVCIGEESGADWNEAGCIENEQN